MAADKTAADKIIKNFMMATAEYSTIFGALITIGAPCDHTGCTASVDHFKNSPKSYPLEIKTSRVVLRPVYLKLATKTTSLGIF